MVHPLTKQPLNNAVVIKVLLTAICGSDLHAYKGRTSATPGSLVFGHEMTGEVIECGKGINKVKVGDWVTVPFNISCGVCDNCKRGYTNNCQTSGGLGGIYGYAAGGGWQGGQAEYALIPYADANLTILPPVVKQNPQMLMDVVMLSDIIPTGFHGAVCAKVRVGSTVYVAGAGPVGLSAVLGAKMLGAAAIFVGDMKDDRLALAKKIGGNVYPCDLKKMDIDDVKKYIKSITGAAEVDCAVDAVGYEATGHKHEHQKDSSMAAFNACIAVTRATGAIGTPGAYFTGDPGGADSREQKGQYTADFGDLWMKSLVITTGQCPVQRYNRRLLNKILFDSMHFSQFVNGIRISLDDAPAAFKQFANGRGCKFVIDPHHVLGKPQPLSSP